MKTQLPRWFVLFFLLTRVALSFQAGSTPTTTTLQSSTNPSTLSQTVTLTAAVAPVPLAGKVTFYDGVTVLGVTTLSAGKAALTTPLLPSGIRSLKAFYSGDTQFQSSVSAPLLQAVMALAQKGFQPPVSLQGVNFIRTIAVADFNGDGIADLAVDGYDVNLVGVFLGKGDGTFRPPVTYAVQQAPIDVVAADLNGDGRMDLVVANGATPSDSVSVLLGNGEGTFRPAVNYHVGVNPNHLVVADFNGDGVPDIATSNYTDGNINVLLGVGDGTFRTPVAYTAGTNPGTISAADFNGDGRVDLVIPINKGVNVLLGNGNGSFQPPVNFAAGLNPGSVAVGDFNGDGKADLAISSGADDTVSVLLGNGNGTFQPAVNYSSPKNAQAVAVGDFNGDGHPDLVVSHSGTSNVTILLGNGDGTFQAPVSYDVGGQAIFAAVGDFNGDGRSDLIVANFLAGASVLLGTPVFSPPAILTASPLMPGTVGVAYSQTLSANGGKPPYTWSIIAGALPPGLTLSAAGAITGTPTAPGTSTFTVQVTDGASATVTQVLTLTIAPPVSTNSLALNPQSVQFSYNLGDPDPDPQTVMVTATSDPPLSLTATVSVDGDVPWQQIDTPAGATPANIQVSVANLDMLVAGVYQGLITVTAPNADPATVAVQLTVVDPNAVTGTSMRKRPARHR